MTTQKRYTVRAVVVGAGINGLGVLRSLARAGVPTVVVAASPELPAMRSRHGHKWVYADRYPGALLDALDAVADEMPEARPVLFLTEEETVSMAVNNHHRLQARYRLTMPEPSALTSLLHKSGIRATAEASGSCVPRTLWVQSSEQIHELDELRMPIVIKPAVRDPQYAEHFDKAYRIYDRDQARTLLERMLPVLPDIIVQEWIQGTDSDLYFCLQYLPPNSHDAPVSFVGRKIRSWPPHVGGTASCIAAPEAVSIAQQTTAFFRHAGVTGLAGLEYKRDARYGDYFVVEPTVGRTDFQEEVATLNGVNLPLAAYCGSLGYAMPKMHQPARSRMWRERTSDLQATQLTPAGETRLPERASTRNALWRLDDPRPAMSPFARRLRNKLARMIRIGARDHELQ